jgi:hypothetical protein
MALPFVSGAKPDELLADAFDHPHCHVRLQAARVAAEMGRDAGYQALARACLDIKVDERARAHLEELGREDLIPAEANEADFKARANFAEWLAHPNELGVPPDEVEIIDRRELNWPPDRQPIPVWLLRYRVSEIPTFKFKESGQDAEEAADDQNAGNVEVADGFEDASDIASQDDDDMTTDVGFVGSMTFCLFTYGLGTRPPEDGYAMHCYLELVGIDLIAEELGDDDHPISGYDHLLERCPIEGIESARIVLVVEFADVLQYRARLAAIASATRFGEKGWVVLDGPRTRWYPLSEMPTSTDRLVMMVHVGRVLLGFTDEPDRRKYLVRKTTK